MPSWTCGFTPILTFTSQLVPWARLVAPRAESPCSTSTYPGATAYACVATVGRSGFAARGDCDSAGLGHVPTASAMEASDLAAFTAPQCVARGAAGHHSPTRLV